MNDNPISEQTRPSALQKVARRFTDLFGAVFSWLIFPFLIVLFLHNFVFQAYHVVGSSMVPSLKDSDYLIISKLGGTSAMVQRLFGNEDKAYIPTRGQIVVFRYPDDKTKVFVKRVVGVPGDRVVVRNGQLRVYNDANPNGLDPDVGVEKAGTVTLIETDEVVKPGNVYVIGDNRQEGGSFDSRQWGQLPSEDLIGNAVLRLLPLDQVKVFQP